MTCYMTQDTVELLAYLMASLLSSRTMCAAQSSFTQVLLKDYCTCITCFNSNFPGRIWSYCGLRKSHWTEPYRGNIRKKTLSKYLPDKENQYHWFSWFIWLIFWSFCSKDLDYCSTIQIPLLNMTNNWYQDTQEHFILNPAGMRNNQLLRRFRRNVLQSDINYESSPGNR